MDLSGGAGSSEALPITRGFVLAGGLSRRFGSDKAVAELEGQPAVVTLVRRLEEAGLVGTVVWRVSRPELGVREIIEGGVTLGPPGASGDDRHPLFGLAAIGGDEDVFVCPCDAVNLTVEMVRRLCEAHAVSFDSPLCGVWPAALRRRAGEHAGSNRSVRSLAEGLRVLDVGSVGNRNERA